MAAAAAAAVTDSTDWLPTALPGFAALDAALRCQVCKEFYDTPMVTSCAHTFCSLCIRRCLAAEGRCPTCRAPDQESKLRRNGAVEEVVDAFVAARSGALALATAPTGDGQGESGDGRGRKRKRKVGEAGLEGEGEGEGRQTRARTLRTRAREAEVPSSSHEDEEVDGDEVVDLVQEEEQGQDDDDGEYRPDDGLVPCPMCGKRMKEEAVFHHLDRCDEEKAQTTKKSSAAAKSSSSFTSRNHHHTRPSTNPLQQTRRTTTSTPQPPPSRITQLNYSLLTDRALKRKLMDLGIPSHGPKPLLQRRHTEWVSLWNANCDSSRPRSKRELLRELDIWERSQGSGGAGSGAGSAAGNAVMQKDFDATGWARGHKSDFDELIRAARRKREATATTTTTITTTSTTTPPLTTTTTIPPAAEPAPEHNQNSQLRPEQEQERTSYPSSQSQPPPNPNLSPNPPTTDLTRPSTDNAAAPVLATIRSAKVERGENTAHPAPAAARRSSVVDLEATPEEGGGSSGAEVGTGIVDASSASGSFRDSGGRGEDLAAEAMPTVGR